MNTNFDVTPIYWYQNEDDEQPTGVLVQASNGDTQYMTIEEYNKFVNNE